MNNTKKLRKDDSSGNGYCVTFCWRDKDREDKE